ncbi:MAG: hypothetical protein U0U67_03495 [Chitinophagales bacterium]
MTVKDSIKNTNLFFNLIVAVVCIFLLISILQYFKTKGFYGTYNYAQFAFTYQKCGYITRGLIPAIFQWLHIKNTILFVFIFTGCQLAFSVLFLNIGAFNLELKYTYMVFFFSSLGVLHFALDSFRLDVFIYMLSLIVYISLSQQKIIIATLMSIIAIIIHEAAYFLIVPLFFMFFKPNKKRFLLGFFFTSLFLISVVTSNLIDKNSAIQLIKDFTQLNNVPEHYYLARISSTTETLRFYFSIFNVKVNVFFVMLFVLLFIFISTKQLFKDYFYILFPLLLCIIAIDWYRWIHMVYFLLFLVLIKENISIPKSKAIKIILYSYLIGIPVAMYIKGSIIYTIALRIVK